MFERLHTSDDEIMDRRDDRGSRDRSDRDDRGDDRDGEGRGRRSFHRKKVCKFCADNEYPLDYKEVRVMQSFVTERGRIVPRRISGTCASHQRKLTTALKRARNLALVGFVHSGATEQHHRS